MSQPQLSAPDARPAAPAVWKRAEVFAVVIIVMLALAVRIAFVYQVHTTPFEDLRSGIFNGTDMQRYDETARRVLQNGWIDTSADASPLYPYVALPLFYLLTGSTVLYTLVIQSLVDTATVLLIYLLARRLYGVRAAVYAAIAAALYAPFIVYQGQLLSETVLNLFIAAFFVVMLGAGELFTPRRAIASGVLLGLAVAARPTCLVFAPLAFFFIAKACRWRIRPSFVSALVFAAACAAVLAPFAWRNYRSAGEFHIVRGNSGIMFHMDNNPQAAGACRQPNDLAAPVLEDKTAAVPLSGKDRIYRDAALDFIRANPRDFLRLLWTRFSMFFGGPEVSNNVSVELYRQVTLLENRVFLAFGLVLPFAVVGFFFSLKSRGVIFVLLQVLAYSTAMILFVVVGRHRLAVVPLILPAAGYAAQRMIAAVKEMSLSGVLAVALPVASLAFVVNYFAISTAVGERLHPDGFVSRSGSTVVIHDDSDYLTPYGVPTLSADARVGKSLIVDEPLTGLAGAAVTIQLAVRRPGVLEVEFNDYVHSLNLDASPRRSVSVLFPPEAVRSGLNTVYLKGNGKLDAFIYADDVYRFRRSFYSTNGLDFMLDDFDQVSFGANRSLHIGGHEFKIRLELDYASPPDETSAASSGSGL